MAKQGSIREHRQERTWLWYLLLSQRNLESRRVERRNKKRGGKTDVKWTIGNTNKFRSDFTSVQFAHGIAVLLCTRENKCDFSWFRMAIIAKFQGLQDPVEMSVVKVGVVVRR